MAIISIYPVSDNTDGDWVNEAGINTNLFASIDEVTLNQADYIVLSNSTSNCLFNWTQLSGYSGFISELIFYAQAVSNINVAGIADFGLNCIDTGHQTAITLTTSSANYHVHYAANPHTGVAWTWAQVNSQTSGFYGTGVWVLGKDVVYTQPQVYQTRIDVVYVPRIKLQGAGNWQIY